MTNYSQYLEISRFDLKRLRFFIDLVGKHVDDNKEYHKDLLEMIDTYLYPHKRSKNG